MNKAYFIQQLVIRTCPSLERLPDTIKHGEQLWQGLTRAGFGDKKPAEPRDIKEDVYSLLDPRQQAWFDKFWLAFNHKVGKQRAAMRQQQRRPFKNRRPRGGGEGNNGLPLNCFEACQ